jgi:hypothetical protein
MEGRQREGEEDVQYRSRLALPPMIPPLSALWLAARGARFLEEL